MRIKQLRRGLRVCYDRAMDALRYAPAGNIVGDKVIDVARQFACDVSLNIDVYDLDGSYRLFREYCDRYDLCDNCPIHKMHGAEDCYRIWLFMPPDLERKRREKPCLKK